MRKQLSIAVWAAVFITLSWNSSPADNPEAIAANSDLGRLQGRWTARAGSRKEIQVILAFRGRRVDVDITTKQGVRLQVEGEVKVDEKTTPRRLDWLKLSTADQQEFPQIAGIYKLDGDTFTVCNGGMNGVRPKEFKPGDGVLSEVVVFQRERVASADRAKSSSSPTTTTR
jgi:uncharacterized protein (TIGR03067 family)